MLRRIGAIAVLLTVTMFRVAEAQPGATFFVAPYGDDANPGTLDQPFRTLEKARDAVRSINQTMTGDIHVYLRAGTYILAAPLQLTSADSGSNGFSVIWEAYQGEDAILSGGTVVTGWTQAGSLWTAPVGNIDTRTLYVNGARAQRARSADGMGITLWTNSDGDRLGYRLPPESPVTSFANPGNIEIVSRVAWKEYRCGVATMGQEVTMDEPCWSDAQSHVGAQMDVPSWVENARELIDLGGEWYLDRANPNAGQLYYKPRGTETIGEAIIGRLEHLIVGEGTSADKIRNITLKGLMFAYTTWLRPNSPTSPTEPGYGFPELQGNLVAISGRQPPAAVAFSYAEGVRIEGNVFARLGTAGVGFGRASVNNSVVGNHFYDISSGALFLGGPWAVDVLGNVVANNFVEHIGVEYHGAAGLWAGLTRHTVIRHNEIRDVPYDGISIGWAWDPANHGAGDNKILNNWIGDHMTVMADGGGIYSLGAADDNYPRSEYAYNVVQEQASNNGAAVYLDDGSRRIDVHHNALFDSNLYTFLAKGQDHKALDNWWQNRFPRDILFVFATTNSTYYFSNNTCYRDGGPVDCGSLVNGNIEIETSDDVPAEILAGAGIEPQYQYIKTRLIPSCPTMSIGNPTVMEGTGGAVNAVFPVWLSCPVPGAAVTVNYATVNGTAIAGSDFSAVSGTLTFPPGVINGTIDAPVLGDSLDEAVETFFVDLSNPTNAVIASGRGTASIEDDDPHPVVAIGNVTVMEGNAGTFSAVLQVSLSATSGQTASVAYATQDGTATTPSDYTATNGVLTFGPGVVSQNVDVPIVGDTVWERDESFFVNLSVPQNLTVGDGEGEVDIVDDELPLLSIGDARLPEGPPTAPRNVTVSLNEPSIVNVTVDYQAADCTATKFSDYLPLSGTLTFLPGQTSKTITVSGLGDPTFEASETYLVELSSPVQATIVDGRGQVTLVNDDPNPNPPLGLPPADFNGDGMTDLIWRHETAGQLSAWLMESINLVSGSIFQTLSDLSWKVAGTADFNADGKTDIVWRHDLSGQLAFWFMDGLTLNGGTLIDGMSDTSWRVYGTGDFNSDGKPDFLWRNDATGSLTAWLMNGTTLATSTPLNPSSVADLDWRPVGTGDFNHDGKTDILWRHQGSTQIVAWLMDGVNLAGGGFLTPSTLDPSWLPSATGDFNGDEHTDILWRHQASNELVVWLMNGMTQTCGVFLNPDRMTDANWKVAGPR
jgi:hypothetical protein